MAKKRNSQYLLLRWIPAILLLALMLVILGGRLLQGDYLQVLFIVGITGIVVAWGIYGSLFQVGQLLKAPSPEPLVAYYDKRLGKLRIADLDANLPFSKGLFYTLYGRFESARTVINKVNWEQKPPLVQAPKIFLEALWAFLERHEFRQGLLLAQGSGDDRRILSLSGCWHRAERIRCRRRNWTGTRHDCST